MSFLWRGNIQADNNLNTCKDCIDKNKRITDYELFFNETKDILKKKDEDLLDAQNRLLEQQKKLEEFEVTTQAQIVFREKLIEQYELSKKIYGEEKRQWLEDRKILKEEINNFRTKSLEWENEKSNFEDKIESFNDDKIIWKQHQKVLEDKISTLSKEISKWEIKHNELSREQEDREEKLIQTYQEKLESLGDLYEEKEMEWKSKEAEYEYAILQYQENENDYEMKILDVKYEMEDKLQKLEKEMARNLERNLESKYKSIQEEKDKCWEERIEELNLKYDEEFIQFRENLKARENKLECEKEQVEKLLKEEIQRLKDENVKLEEENRKLEKKRLEVTMENRGLAADNDWLEKEWKDSQDEIQKLHELKDKLEYQQKKIEEEYEKLKKECKEDSERREEERQVAKQLEERQVANHKEESQNSVETQTLKFIEQKLKDNTFNPNMDLVDYVQDLVYEPVAFEPGALQENTNSELRKRNIKKKKKKLEIQSGLNIFVHPSVEEMHKNNETQKKIESEQKQMEQSQSMYYSKYFLTKPTDSHIIDINSSDCSSSDMSNDDKQPDYDTNNFFLRIVGLVKSMSSNDHLQNKITELEKKISQYQNEIHELKEKNSLYQNKINKYECNSIIELNRKLRTGVPVHFYPYHSNSQIINTSHIHSVDLDLH